MMLSDVCLSDIWRLSVGPKSRTERPRKTKIGIEEARVTQVTRIPLSRSKGQSHQAALLTAASTQQATATVSVGKYSPWEPTATLPSAGVAVGSAAARGASAPTQGGEGRRHIVAAAPYNLFVLSCWRLVRRRIKPQNFIHCECNMSAKQVKST